MGFNQTSSMHILPVCSSVSCTKRSEAANADLYGNAAEREQSLTYKLCRSSLDAAAAVRRSIFAPFRRVAQARMRLGSACLCAPVSGADIHYYTERRGCVVRRTVAGLFLSSTSEFEGRSQRGLIFTESQRGGLLAWRGGKERRGEGKEGGKVY